MKHREIMWERCDWFDDVEDDEEDDAPQGLRVHQLIMTPFGIAKLSDRMSPTTNTDFFIGHANFNVGESVFNSIEATEGVEFLKVISRYRFVLGVGHAFDNGKVKRGVEKAVGILEFVDTNDVNEIPEALRPVANKIMSSLTAEKYWGAYIFPNGEYVVETCVDKTEFDAKCKTLNEMCSISRGVVITSDE